MSLLWARAVRHEAMPWHHDRSSIVTHHVVHPVKNAGFASYTDDAEDVEDRREHHAEFDDHNENHFDEDLYDQSTPDPTDEEHAHYREHDEWPESYYERHDQAYQKAKDDKKRRQLDEDTPDRDDRPLMKFVGNHGADTDLWRKHGTFGPVSLKRPVHATQSHVSQGHIDRYLANPGERTEHVQRFGPSWNDYLGDEAPMFVTHHGELHTTEGHHRVAAALQRGDASINGWHYDLDKDPAKIRPHVDSDWDPDDEDYT